MLTFSWHGGEHLTKAFGKIRKGGKNKEISRSALSALIVCEARCLSNVSLVGATLDVEYKPCGKVDRCWKRCRNGAVLLGDITIFERVRWGGGLRIGWRDIKRRRKKKQHLHCQLAYIFRRPRLETRSNLTASHTLSQALRGIQREGKLTSSCYRKAAMYQIPFRNNILNQIYKLLTPKWKLYNVFQIAVRKKGSPWSDKNNEPTVAKSDNVHIM